LDAEWTEDELHRLDLARGGHPTPYEPSTSLETLGGTPVCSSATGLLENVKYKMQAATSSWNGAHKYGQEHLTRMQRGDGTFFESAESKRAAEAYNNQNKRERAQEDGREYKPEKLRTLPEAERKVLARRWAAGQYELPKNAQLKDVLGQVAAYARRNETYLTGDGKKMEEKLRSLLPAEYQKANAGKTVPKPL